MTLAQQYDAQKQEVADRSREMDAVDEVLQDVVSLFGTSIDEEEHETLLEEIETCINYNESLEYILSQIPDKVKAVLVQS